jgi:hypothetical protein
LRSLSPQSSTPPQSSSTTIRNPLPRLSSKNSPLRNRLRNPLPNPNRLSSEKDDRLLHGRLHNALPRLSWKKRIVLGLESKFIWKWKEHVWQPGRSRCRATLSRPDCEPHHTLLYSQRKSAARERAGEGPRSALSMIHDRPSIYTLSAPAIPEREVNFPVKSVFSRIR